jgi:hypothetical protein
MLLILNKDPKSILICRICGTHIGYLYDCGEIQAGMHNWNQNQIIRKVYNVLEQSDNSLLEII